jgi:hypothetical protein
MSRADDPAISGDRVLYRRIPPHPDSVTWDDQGVPAFSSANFRDQDNELSMHLAAETSPDTMLIGHEHFGLIWMTAGKIRAICEGAIIICRDDEKPANGHVLICGKISGGKARRLKGVAQWVEGRWPARPVSGPGQIDPLNP